MEPENKTQSTPPSTGGKGIQTYIGDMSKALEENKQGLVKKIIQEQENIEMRSTKFSPQLRRNKLFLAISLILVFSAIFIAAYFFFKKKDAGVPVVAQFTPPIFVDETDFLEIGGGIDKEEIIKQISAKVAATKIRQSEVEGIYFTDNGEVVGLRKFISLIKSSFIPGSEVLISDNFLAGAINTNTSEDQKGGDFFILLKARSFVDIFPPMKAWEEKMFSDISSLFGITINSSTNYLSNEKFKDGVVENKNARILYDQDNKIVMMYVFVNDTSVVVTDTEAAAREVILRLSSSQIKK